MQAAPVDSSRLIVKNLPKYVNENRLKEMFGCKGKITDVKVARTKDGRSRCFGFVGFQTESQAAEAKAYFNKAFMDTSRLEVTFAESLRHGKAKAAPLQQPPPPPVSKDPPQRKKSAQQVLAEKVAEDPQLADFLQLVKPRSSTKTFTNDELTPEAFAAHLASKQSAKGAATGTRASAGKKEATAADAEEADVHEDASDMDVSDMEYLRSRQSKRVSVEADSDDADAEYLKRHRLRTLHGDVAAERDLLSDSPSEGSPPESPQHRAPSARARAAPAPAGPGAQRLDVGADEHCAQVRRTGRLFLRNLPYTATEEDVLTLCSAYGPVEDAQVLLDRKTSVSKGLALVTFMHAKDAVDAYQALDGVIFQGRLLHVLPGNAKQQAREAGEGEQDDNEAEGDDGAESGGGGGKGSFKTQREAARKADAGNRRAWCTLFMRDDTVAEATAALLGVSKAELLDPTADDTAVRLALGEAQVLAATKEELKQRGVNVAALEQAADASGSAADRSAVARSAVVLLVKNLPFSATEAEIQRLFEKYDAGALVLMPSTRALAVVQLADKKSAQAAFRGLAYRRLHSVPLYLEFAPAAIFDSVDPRSQRNSNGAAAPGAEPAPRLDDAAATNPLATDATDEHADTCSVFVKNLAFETPAEVVRRKFDAAATAEGGLLRAVRLVTAKRRDGKVLPKGFAFAECSDHATACGVVRRLQGVMLDGHRLELQLATGRGKSGAPAKEAKAGPDECSNKLLVRNLAFQAASKDVRGLMAAYGHVKSCRLPNKFDGKKRGFAFVEFGSKDEARKAMAALQGTHLYGRRLLLEYAKEEEGIEALREKAAAQLLGENARPRAGGKKRKREAA